MIKLLLIKMVQIYDLEDCPSCGGFFIPDTYNGVVQCPFEKCGLIFAIYEK